MLSYFSMNIDSIEGHEDYLLSKITPIVQLEHIRQHLDTLNRVVQDKVVMGKEMTSYMAIKVQETVNIVWVIIGGSKWMQTEIKFGDAILAEPKLI